MPKGGFMRNILFVLVLLFVGCSLLPSFSENIESQSVDVRAEYSVLSDVVEVQSWMLDNIEFRESVSTGYRSIKATADSGHANNLELCLLYLNIRYVALGEEGYLLVLKNTDYNYPKTRQYVVVYSEPEYNNHVYAKYKFSDLFY